MSRRPFSYLVIGLIAANVLSFAWGLFAGTYKVFPFNQIQAASRSLGRILGSGEPYVPDYYLDTAGRVAKSCPTDAAVVVAAGQSNAANHLSSYGTLDRGIAAYNFFNGECYLMEDPVLGATGARGSLWVDFSHRLSEALDGRPIVMITGAVGRSAVEDWLDDEVGYSQKLEVAISEAIGKGLRPDLFIWHQGETDALVNTSKDTYRERLLDVIDGYEALSSAAGEKAPWIVFQTSVCYGTPDGNPDITEAQRDASAARDFVYLGPNTDNLGGEYRSDGCHFNWNGKQTIVSALVAAIMSNRLIEP